MRFLYAMPDDPNLDSFQSGDEEVDAFFISRKWYSTEKKKTSPPTYVFHTQEGGETIGYAAVSYQNAGHPYEVSSTRARYLTVYAVGLNIRFQGVKNPQFPDETYAASIFREIERMAREKPDCIGISLWVRITNERAIRFYQKVGFVADPAGPVQRDHAGGAAHLTMRKRFVPL